MKKILLIISFLILLTDFSFGQILPANRYFTNNRMLDLTLNPTSFAYSFRKLRVAYNGFALKIRRGTDNAEANVAFDIKEIVSQDSNVTITNIGSSGLVINQVLNLATFIGSQTIFVSVWYDQSVGHNYDAIQGLYDLQPKLVLNSSGVLNNMPSILFNGTNRERLIVERKIDLLTNQGVNATYMTVLKPTENSKEQLSFGVQDSNLNRWTIQANWNDDNLYFDAADGVSCCASNRYFKNDFNMFFYKQYSFIRGSNYKTGRYNQNATALNNSPAPATPFVTGNNFGIGYWSLDCCLSNPGFYGNVTEIVMFPTDLLIPELSQLEGNQMNFWQL